MTVNVTSAAANTYSNTIAVGAVTSANAGANSVAANATLTVLSGITVAKAFNLSTVGIGDTSVLTVTLTNPNATAVTGAAFTDNYPAGLVNTARRRRDRAAAAYGHRGERRHERRALGRHGAREQLVHGHGERDARRRRALILTPRARVATDTGTAAAATATLTVLSRPIVTKAFAPTSVGINGVATLTVTLTNPNTTAITGAAFTDTYPANLVNAAVPGGATTCAGGSVTANAGAGSLALSGGTIPASGSCTVSVNVTSAIAASYANTIPIAALTTTNGGSNDAAASATLSVLGGLTVAKAFAPIRSAPPTRASSRSR